jgi:hypothetical protein
MNDKEETEDQEEEEFGRNVGLHGLDEGLQCR